MFDSEKLHSLTMEQGIVLSIMTGIGLAPVGKVIEDVERRLERTVQSREFLNKEFIKELQALYFADFTKLMVPTPLVEAPKIIIGK